MREHGLHAGATGEKEGEGRRDGFGFSLLLMVICDVPKRTYGNDSFEKEEKSRGADWTCMYSTASAPRVA